MCYYFGKLGSKSKIFRCPPIPATYDKFTRNSIEGRISLYIVKDLRVIWESNMGAIIYSLYLKSRKDPAMMYNSILNIQYSVAIISNRAINP